jgi:hypothetical protein
METKLFGITYVENRERGTTCWRLSGPANVVWPGTEKMEILFQKVHPLGGLEIEYTWKEVDSTQNNLTLFQVTMPSGLHKSIRSFFIVLLADASVYKNN